MAKAIERLEINELRDKLTAFLNKVGISGSADVTINDKEDAYIIKIGEHTFIGFYPQEENIFTLQIINSYKELPTDINVDYIEAFVFDARTFIPLEFIIYQYPQSQTYYLNDGEKFKKGMLLYETACPFSGGVSTMEFAKPVFESEIIDFELLKELWFVPYRHIPIAKTLHGLTSRGELSFYNLEFNFPFISSQYKIKFKLLNLVQ